MPTLSITKGYATGSALTKSHLDTAYGDVETFLNTTKIDSSNIQSGGIATANYAAASVDATALASNAVTTAKITDLNVTTAKINDLAVTTAKINDAAVTQAKRASLGQQISSSCGNFSTSSSSYTDVTNLSISITTTGRPVWIGLISDGTDNTNPSRINHSSGFTNIQILRGATSVASFQLGDNTPNGAVPCSVISHIDVPSASTYTYKVQMLGSGGISCGMVNVKLAVYEL